MNGQKNFQLSIRTLSTSDVEKSVIMFGRKSTTSTSFSPLVSHSIQFKGWVGGEDIETREKIEVGYSEYRASVAVGCARKRK